MSKLISPRFFGEEVLESCLSGHRIFAGSGDPPESVAVLQVALAKLGFAITIDGVFGNETGTAVSAYKTRKGLAPTDPVVGEGTMRALDADFAHELIDMKAAAFAGGLFDLGLRMGTRVDLDNSVATCRFERGLAVEVAHAHVYAVPSVFERAWTAAGGFNGTFGVPTSDPFQLDVLRIAQEFTLVTHIVEGVRQYTLPGAVWETSMSGAFDLGVPVASPVALGEDGTNFTQHERGVVLAVPGASPQALPQAVFDLWSAQEAAGASLGPPDALGFPSGTSTIFPFRFGSIVLDKMGIASLAGLVNEDLQRYFLPQNDAQFTLGPIAGTQATSIISGAEVFKAMRADLAAATGPADFVYLLSWHCNIDLELVTGDSSSTLRAMLPVCVAGGAQVRMMLWAGDPVPAPPVIPGVWPFPQVGIPWYLIKQYAKRRTSRTVNEPTVNFVNGLAGAGDAAAVLDDRHLLFGSHHQKLVVIKAGARLVAYIGGVEPNFDRMLTVTGEPGSPLFDISVRHEDAAAWLALQSFILRWDLHPNRTGAPLRGGSLSVPAHAGPLTVQVTHTYGRDFPFTGVAVQTASTAIANGIKSARQFIYIEDQYCVGSPKMRTAIQDLLSSQPNVKAIFLIAAEDSVQDTPDVAFRRRQFFQSLVPAFTPRVLVFERLGAGSPTGPTAYVHSKLLIVDDEAAFIGSPNSNRRSWFHDSEIDATIVDGRGAGGTASGTRGWVRDFRCELWSRHLGVAASTLGYPAGDITLWELAHAGSLPGTTVRPYNIFMVPPRPSLGGIQAPDPLLDRVWDGVVDPM